MLKILLNWTYDIVCCSKHKLSHLYFDIYEDYKFHCHVSLITYRLGDQVIDNQK